MRIVRYLFLGILLLALAVSGGWYWLGRAGESNVEGWVKTYLMEVLAEYLNPSVEMQSLDYRFPRTVVIDELRMKSDDIAILAVKRLELTLAETPRRGQPIVIAEIKLDGPRIELRSDEAGQLVGWSRLIREKIRTNPDSAPAGKRVSDFLRLRHGGITAAEIVYQRANGPAMQLAGIDFDLSAAPSSQNPGLYQIQAALVRKELLEFSIDANFNLDTAELQVNQAVLTAEVSADRYQIFPPEIQTLLNTYEIAGKTQVSLKGRLNPAGMFDITGTLKLRNAVFRLGEKPAHIDNLSATFSANPQQILLNGECLAFSGKTTFNIALTPAPFQSTIRVEPHDIELEQVGAALPPAAKQFVAEYQPAGQAAGTIEIKLSSDNWNAKSKLSVSSPAFNMTAERIFLTSLDVDATVDPENLKLEMSGPIGPGNAEFHLTKTWAINQPTRIDITAHQVPAERVPSFLPAGLAQQMRARKPNGLLDGKIEIVLQPGSKSSPSVRAQIRSDSFRLGMLDRLLTFDGLNANFDLSESVLKWDAKAQTLGGQVSCAATSSTNAPDLTQLSAEFQNIDLAAAIANATAANAQVGNDRWKVDGRLSGKLAGTWNGHDLTQSLGSIDLQIANAAIIIGETKFALPRVDLKVGVSGRQCNWSAVSPFLEGSFSAGGTLALAAPHQLAGTWRGDGMRLEKLSELRKSTKQSRYLGRTDAQGEINCQLDRWRDSFHAPGTIRISEGRLIEIPIVEELARFVHGALPILPVADRDEASATFRAFHDRIEIIDAKLNAALLALRGTGQIYFDNRVDLSVRGGPLSKLAGVLGPIGDIVGGVSEKAVEYHVGGTLDKPHVTIHPFARIRR